ncbi:MAG: O-antigen ligase family protein [Bacteroidales bacterium]|jgi:hypothetical protein|nr:O-antigen ligase family protein [Bacteroidales bacterium]
MTIRFSHVVLISTILLGGLIYVLHLRGFVTPANEVYARFCAIGIFSAGFLLLALQKARPHHVSWADFYKNDTLIIVSLTLLLASSFVLRDIAEYLVAHVGVAALSHFCYTRKFYPPIKLFYFVFLYALLMFFGTIGTQKGFHFPERTLTFYVLPLSLCFFRLSKETLLKIGEVFFKMAIIFTVVCILYWWYNFLYLDTIFSDWVLKKTAFCAVIDEENILCQSSYFWVNKWSGYYHPSFISFVLFFGLIISFYLHSQKRISKFELILSIALCFSTVTLMQSRIGIVGVLLIAVVSELYYLLKNGKRLAALAFSVCVLIVGVGLHGQREKIDFEFTEDKIRETYNQIAVSYIKDNFWWGSGFRDQREAMQQQAEMMKDELPPFVYPHTEFPIYYVHNQFYGDMVQFGIWGLIALLLMLGAIAFYAIKNRCYLLQMTLFATFLLMVIEEPFYIAHSFVRFALFLVFFVAIIESEKQKTLNNT